MQRVQIKRDFLQVISVKIMNKVASVNYNRSIHPCMLELMKIESSLAVAILKNLKLVPKKVISKLQNRVSTCQKSKKII